ncbi:hypothetical protein QYF68_09970 [Mycolicibacterium austroafricanum]|uniref:Uncharacterized protein n=1 Tax=Mycolicibacterium austroafricanum TaxID=39687 RepID=A0ABT8HBM8_MYCAO|nr:hypothetical protein [Mycolicibacterium austroafricanum]MDN4518151.1 hypothetical protein [Mycolicibacterium austroafricanum]
MSAYDPEKMAEQRKLIHESMRAEFVRRAALQRNGSDGERRVVDLDHRIG